MDNREKYIQLIIRYAVSTAGIFLVAFAISLMVCCNLGVSTLSGPPYVLTHRFPGSLTLGQYTILVNSLFIIIQIAVLRRRFKLRYLLQILASVVFGAFIDLSGMMLSWLEPVHLADRVALLIVGCAISAIGVSMEVIADTWMLSAEMTADAIAIVSGFKFRNVKVVMDCIILLITVFLCVFCFGNPFCAGTYTGIWDAMTAKTPGTVIGIGTIVAAVLIGLLMRFTDPVVEKWMQRLLK